MNQEIKLQALEDQVSDLENLIFRIMNYLSIDTEKTKCYSFISDSLVRRQLELDHILMLRTPASDFNQYCQYALFQVENLLNYYFTIRFRGKPEEAKSYFNEKDDSTDELGKSNSLNYRVSKIPYGTKFFKFSKEFLSDYGKPLSLSLNLQKIAYVRHSTVHRNTVDIEVYENETLSKYVPIKNKRLRDLTSEEEKDIYKLGQKIEFKRSYNFALVNNALIDFIEIIQPEIENLQKNSIVSSETISLEELFDSNNS